jgi:hypothetical protein
VLSYCKKNDGTQFFYSGDRPEGSQKPNGQAPVVDDRFINALILCTITNYEGIDKPTRPARTNGMDIAS